MLGSLSCLPWRGREIKRDKALCWGTASCQNINWMPAPTGGYPCAMLGLCEGQQCRVASVYRRGGLVSRLGR